LTFKNADASGGARGSGLVSGGRVAYRATENVGLANGRAPAALGSWAAPLAQVDSGLDRKGTLPLSCLLMPLSAADIREAFARLAEELAREHQRAELVVVGGAALVLLFSARDSTKDVDALFIRPEASRVRAAAARVAELLALPDDWLNDGAKGYMVGISSGETLYDTPSLLVRAASTEQLLAMKLCAWRDAIDRADARLLLSTLKSSKEDIWASIEPFVPRHDLDKASYAFEDLWELLNGAR
jgi:hypothetical protein